METKKALYAEVFSAISSNKIAQPQSKSIRMEGATGKRPAGALRL